MKLQTGTYLQGDKYRIIDVLGQGGFGITYLALQELADRKVCIKEFFPKDYYNRETDTQHVTLGSQGSAEAMERYKEKFIKEAKTIARLDHPNIIHIHDVFKENNTCYYVMDYIDGESLQSLVKREGALPEAAAVAYIREAGAALGHIHSLSINHLDIKPGNIMVRKSDDRAILIDFGLSKQYDAMGNQTSSTPVGISHGFAPMEQYKTGGVSEFTPATDVYSLGATLYYLVTGCVPPQASDIAEDGLPELPAHLSAGVKRAIADAMQTRRKDRVQSVDAFLALLDESKVAAAPTPTPAPAPVVDESTRIGVAAVDESTKLGEAPKQEPKRVETPKRVEEPKKEWTPKYDTKKPKQEKRKSRLWSWLLALLLIGGGTYFIIDANRSDDNSSILDDKITEDSAEKIFEKLYSAYVNDDHDQFISTINKMQNMYDNASESERKMLDDGTKRWSEENEEKYWAINNYVAYLMEQGMLSY